MAKLKISATLEDYLEFIYETVEAKSNIKAIDIANKFGIARASVTEALQRLEQKATSNTADTNPLNLLPKVSN